MLLFQKRFLQGLVDGTITLSFRQWPKACVKPGGRHRVHPIGVVQVDSRDRVALRDIPAKEAVRAPFVGKEKL